MCVYLHQVSELINVQRGVDGLRSQRRNHLGSHNVGGQTKLPLQKHRLVKLCKKWHVIGRSYKILQWKQSLCISDLAAYNRK